MKLLCIIGILNDVLSVLILLNDFKIMFFLMLLKDLRIVGKEDCIFILELNVCFKWCFGLLWYLFIDINSEFEGVKFKV